MNRKEELNMEKGKNPVVPGTEVTKKGVQKPHDKGYKRDLKNPREYQTTGRMFGDYVLNLKYYLVDLNEIEEDYILATNTVIDNIMYCDKFRRKTELADAVRTAFQRVNNLGSQEIEEFENWVRNILLSVCENKRSVVKEILEWARNGAFL